MPVISHTQAAGAMHKARSAVRERGKERSARPWRRIRNMVLARDMYSGQVVRNGKKCSYVGTDCEVDHIKPVHMGGTNDLRNLQTICKQCHSLKTATESNDHGNASMTPAWMPKIAVAGMLFVYCGRPGTDRAEAVKRRMKGGDVVVCLDRMAQEAGVALWDMKREERHALIRLRNQRIADFIKSQPTNHRMFVITVAGKAAQRDYWNERGAEVIIVHEPLEVCQRRIVAMGLPAAVTLEWLNAAQDWS